MNLLSLDCEFNQPSHNLIQIGAVAFKSENCKILDEIMIYVDPKELLNPDIIALTNITDDQLVGAPSAIEAYFKLKEFHAKNKCFMNPVVWGSGVRNDSSMIYDQARPNEPNFMGFRVIDAKTLYQSTQIARSKKIRGGLGTAMQTLGLNFQGRAHDALVDARNTAVTWYHLAQILKGLA